MANPQDCRLIKLEGNNYVAWKWQFQNVLRQKKLTEVLGEGEVTAEKDATALALLGSALSEDNILKICDCVTFKKAWAALQGCYENKTAYEPQALYRRLNTYRIESAKEVSAGLSEIRQIVSQLKNLGEAVSDNMVIGSILSSLPSSFDVWATVWKNSPDRDVDKLITKLMAEATDQLSKINDDEKALVAKKNQKKSSNSKKDECRYCKEKGHWIKDCKKLKTPYDPNRSKKNQKKEEDKDKDKDSNKKDEGFALMTANQSISSEEIWVADTGCTEHMSPHKQLFTNLKPYLHSSGIGTAGSSSLEIKGVGEIFFESGKLSNVLYVPELGQNLLSISALAKNGVSHVGLGDGLIFYLAEKELFRARLIDKLYLVNFKPKKSPNQGKAYVASMKVWHARLGHMSVEGIQYMKKNNVVDGLDIVTKEGEKCEACLLNKCTKASHPSRKTTRSETPGQVLHIDTAGPSKVISLANSLYFVLAKDEASGYRQVAFVQTKDMISNKVKEFVSQTKLETGNDVLKIVTDNGSEFVKADLLNFMTNKGIIHHTSAAYTPQQNGLIERDIRTVKEIAKTMLNNSRVDKRLWAEAINCAVYVANRRITKSNNRQTPYELWHGERPCVKNLRVFGEMAVLRKPDRSITGPWDEKGTIAMFVGYGQRTNTYRFFMDNNIVVSCNCAFLQKMYHSSQVEEKSKSSGDFWISMTDVDLTEDNSDDDLSSFDGDTVLDTTYESPMMVESPVMSEIVESQSQQPEQQQPIFQSPVVQVQSDIQELINVHGNENISLAQGSARTTIRVRDLAFERSTGRWKNMQSGHFVSNSTVNEVANYLRNKTPRANIARALIAMNIKVPSNYKEAIESDQREEWLEAMREEMDSLTKNEVYEIVEADQVKKKSVGSRWVFVIKYKQDQTIEKFKARLVAKGYNQKYGVDYEETYCSVVSIRSTRLLLIYAVIRGLAMRQFDIKTAFLYSKLDEEVYLEIPEGFKQPNALWRLKRSLYGLKQSPRMWNLCFGQFMQEQGLKVCTYDKSVFYRKEPIFIVIVYVDDGLVLAERSEEISSFLERLKKRFEMRELDVHVYRGLQMDIREGKIFLHQSNYTQKVLDTFKMSNSNPNKNPAVPSVEDKSEPLDPSVPYNNAVGSLAYLADTTRPDIAYAVNQLSRKLKAPTRDDWMKVKSVFRYLRGTVGMGIMCEPKGEKEGLVGYSDSDFAGDNKTSKSTTGYVLLYQGVVFHWKSQLQKHVTLSSTEAEVVALCTLAKEMSWLRRMMIEMGIIEEEPGVIRCDNQSALKIVKSEKSEAVRTRHLRAQDAYVREQVELKELIVEYVSAQNQKADLLTKCVATGKFIVNRDSLLSTLDQSK